MYPLVLHTLSSAVCHTWDNEVLYSATATESIGMPRISLCIRVLEMVANAVMSSAVFPIQTKGLQHLPGFLVTC